MSHGMDFRVGDKVKIYDGTVHEILEIHLEERGDDSDVWLKIAERRWVSAENSSVIWEF